MSINAGLWQKRSDQAPVFNVIAMKDNEDEQMNDTHINNCFNQTISEFVFLQTCCYWCSQDYRSHSILHLNECDCNWQTSDYEPSWPLSRWLPGRGIVFFSGQTPLPRSPPPYFLAKDFQQLFIGRDSYLELAKAHAGKVSARLPSKCFIGGASDSSVKPGFTFNFQLLWNVFVREKGVRMDFAERPIPYQQFR